MQMEQDRLHRALSQQLYLLDAKGTESKLVFTIFGTSNSIYKVTFEPNERANCTCKDFVFRGRKKFCKHGFFVLCKVLNIDHWDSMLESTILCREDFDVVRHQFDMRMISSKEKEKEKDDHDDDDPCPICYEIFSEDQKKSCCKRCKKYVHTECMDRWIKMAKTHKKIPSCVYCRTSWTGTGTGTKKECNSIQDFINESVHLNLDLDHLHLD
jgi:hypothetical protein